MPPCIEGSAVSSAEPFSLRLRGRRVPAHVLLPAFAIRCGRVPGGNMSASKGILFNLG